MCPGSLTALIPSRNYVWLIALGIHKQPRSYENLENTALEMHSLRPPIAPGIGRAAMAVAAISGGFALYIGIRLHPSPGRGLNVCSRASVPHKREDEP